MELVKSFCQALIGHVLYIDAAQSHVGGGEFFFYSQEVDVRPPGGVDVEGLAGNLGPLSGSQQVVEPDGPLDVG